MESIIRDFGIDPLLLTAQVVNFFVLLFILKKILYKPILKILEDRKTKIAESLKQAEEIEIRLQKTEEESEKRLEKAAAEARKVLEEASQTASELIAESRVKAQAEIEAMMEKNAMAMQQDRERLQQEFKEEASAIIVKALTKVTGKILDKNDQKQIIEQTIKDL